MIYKTHRIAKVSVSKEGHDLNEDIQPSIDWDELVSKMGFSLGHIMYWEEYKGMGGNNVDFFSIPNDQLCNIETLGGCRYVIIESFNDFNKVMEDFYNGEVKRENKVDSLVKK